LIEIRELIDMRWLSFPVLFAAPFATMLGLAHPSNAPALELAGASSAPVLRLAVLMDHDRRTIPNASQFSATGLVRCGDTVGTAQLVLHRDMIITAAHVLVGPSGARLGCVFTPNLGAGSPIPIEAGTIKAGSRTPLSQTATKDWAVARLAAPASSAVPYGLAPQGAQQTIVTVCAGGNGRPMRFGAESCTVRRIIRTAPDGIRELAIDCSGGPGGSGGALLTPAHAVSAIYVGDRSFNPDQSEPYSQTHYNFAITVDGEFRRAIVAEAR
jgi:hypothetical protein